MSQTILNYFNPSLGKATSATVLLPDIGVKPPYSVLYLLHGYGDDHTIWQRRTSIERYVVGLPVIVVMPDASTSFYCDDPDGMKWETAIAHDLVDYIDTLFQTKAERKGRFVAGLSMGGYGAAKLALKFPERFCSAVSHSGAVEFAHHRENSRYAERGLKLHTQFVSEHPEGGSEDLYALAKKLSLEVRPALRIDCGTEDFLIEENRNFHAYLDEINYAHEYEEFPGAHTWDYWDVHVQDAIAFHRKVDGW